MPIDYSIIITKQELELIPEDRYNAIKTEAQRISTIIDRTSSANKTQYLAEHAKVRHLNKEKYAEDMVFIKTHKTEDYLTKVLLMANTIYANSEMIINILLTKNISYEKLAINIEKIEKLKKLAILKEEMLDNTTTIVDKNLNYLCTILRKYYPYENRNYLIVKLTDIVIHEKELYLNLQGGPITPEKTKTR